MQAPEGLGFRVATEGPYYGEQGFGILSSAPFEPLQEKRPLSLHYFGVWGSGLRVEGLGLGLRMLKTVAGAASSQQPFGAQSKLKTDYCGLVG